jgi:hypothetical protein
MADEGGVDERRDWVGGEREHGGRGDADDIRRNPVNSEPPHAAHRPPTLRHPFSQSLIPSVPPPPRRPCDRLPFTAASRGSPPRSSATGAAEAAGQGDAIEPWAWSSYGCGRRRGRRHGRASVWSPWCGGEETPV